MNSNFKTNLEMMLLCEMEKCKNLSELNELAEQIEEQVELCRQNIDDALDD